MGIKLKNRKNFYLILSLLFLLIITIIVIKSKEYLDLRQISTTRSVDPNLRYQELNISSDGSYYVYTYNLKAYFSNFITTSEIKAWDVKGLGVGGPGCHGANFSANSNYFTLCVVSAEMADIQGQLFLFNRNGKQIKEFNTKKVPSYPGIIWNIFIDDNMLFFQNYEERIIYKYNIVEDKLSDFADDIRSERVELSSDHKYLKLISDSQAYLANPVYKYLEINNAKLLSDKPKDYF